MLETNSIKKFAFALPLGIIFATGLLFFVGSSGTGGVAPDFENLHSATIIKIPDYSSIDWEITVIDESEIWELE